MADISANSGNPVKIRLARSRQERDVEAELRILSIFQRKKDRSYWKRLNFGMKKRQGRSIRIVTEEIGRGAIREHQDQTQA